MRLIQFIKFEYSSESAAPTALEITFVLNGKTIAGKTKLVKHRI